MQRKENKENNQPTETQSKTINIQEKYFPKCICWATIPILSDLIPIFGHTAISDPNGIIYDFERSYLIGKRNHSTCFGEVKKYIELKLDVSDEEYCKAIEKANEKFSHLKHDLVKTNCHAHVSEVLNEIHYLGRNDWNTQTLVPLLVKESKYVSYSAVLLTYAPFMILMAILAFFIYFIFF